MGKNKRFFIQQFWREKKMVGSISPSSPFLTEKMLENVDFNEAKVIIEIGPGTGVFTRRILKKLNPDTRLLVFELNQDFYTTLKDEIIDERCIFINDSAEFLHKYLQLNNLEKVDYIISSLPLSNIPIRIVLKILHTSKNVLTSNGKFIQFQYSLNQKKALEHVFTKVSIDFTTWNIPPAFIYTCSK